MRRFLRQKREGLKLTQKEVAERAGLTRANYSHIERGRSEPSIEQMEAIAKALGIKRINLNFFKNFCDETEQSGKPSTGTDGP